MALLNETEVNFIKLKSLKKEYLQDFCRSVGIAVSSNITKMINDVSSEISSGKLSTQQVNAYIKTLYATLRNQQMSATGASHSNIVKELQRIDSHIWGMVQGALDAHIQTNYVRRYYRYDEMIGAIRGTLYGAVESYALCTWYNHWSTVFLEDLISLNDNVVPIIKKVKGVDIIWNEQPVDIKVTNLPKEWFADGKSIDDAIADPVSVCEYLYRLQGAQRFGAENRLFIIIYNRKSPTESWKIKRNYELIRDSVRSFFDQKISLDQVYFRYNATQHLAHAKVMFIIEEV